MNLWLSRHGVEAVCKTFDSDVAASSDLIRQLLQPKLVSEYGYHFLPVLCRELPRLIPHNPALVEDIYTVAFANPDMNEAKVQMGTGGILSLTTTRQQDYDMALHTLAESYNAFLRGWPEHATRLLVAILPAYVDRQHSYSSVGAEDAPFAFRGHNASVRTDYSFIWDNGVYGLHNEVKMLTAFCQYLSELGLVTVRAEERYKLLDLLAHNRQGLLWRRLLLLGASFPDTWGLDIRELLWAPAILTAPPTGPAARDLAGMLFDKLDVSDRSRIESTVLSLPDGIDGDTRDRAAHIRDLFIAALPAELLALEETVAALAAIKSAPRDNAGAIGKVSGDTQPKHNGIQTPEAQTDTIDNLVARLNSVSAAGAVTAHPQQGISEVAVAIRAVLASLHACCQDSRTDERYDDAWSSLGRACVAICESGEFDAAHEAYGLVTDVLLALSGHPNPRFDADDDLAFEDHPSWSTCVPRVEAARGLALLARFTSDLLAIVASVVGRISADSVAAVRFQVALRLQLMHKSDPDSMWSILKSMCSSELNQSVLGALMTPLKIVGAFCPAEVSRMLSELQQRISSMPNSKAIRCDCAAIFADLAVRSADGAAEAMLDHYFGDVASYGDESRKIVSYLRSALTLGPVAPINEKLDPVRRRAVRIVNDLVTATVSAHREILITHKGVSFQEWPSSDQDAIRELVHIGHTAGMELYFASGAREHQHEVRNGDNIAVYSPEMKRFMLELGPTIDNLLEIGEPGLAYHMLEMFETNIPIDPGGIFLRAHRALMASVRFGNMQNESMAVELIVRFVTRYLAEYRTLLRENEQCRRALVEMLDVFVVVGWPAAVQLTYKLDEIYR